MSAAVELGAVPVPNGQLAYEATGTGHPIVLVHAGVVDRRMWDLQAAAYSERYRVIRYDVRGFGKSSRPTQEYSDADDLSALLRHLDLDLVRLVGVSNGGRIALDFAVSHPESIEALVVAASNVGGFELSQDPEERAAFERLERATSAAKELARTVGTDAGVERMMEIWAPRVKPPERDLVRRMMLENDRAVFDLDPELSTPLDPPTISRLSSLNVPLLVLEGGADQPAFDFIADAIANRVPGALRREVPGGDHLMNLSATDAFDRIVLDFLE